MGRMPGALVPFLEVIRVARTSADIKRMSGKDKTKQTALAVEEAMTNALAGNPADGLAPHLHLFKGNMVSLSTDCDGCWLIQFASPFLTDLLSLAWEFRGFCVKAIEHQHANHVFSKFMKVLGEDAWFIIDEICKVRSFSWCAKHKYGCRILLRWLEHCSDERHSYMAKDLFVHRAADLLRVYQDKFGQHVVKHFLNERGTEEQKCQLRDLLKKRKQAAKDAKSPGKGGTVAPAAMPEAVAAVAPTPFVDPNQSQQGADQNQHVQAPAPQPVFILQAFWVPQPVQFFLPQPVPPIQYMPQPDVQQYQQPVPQPTLPVPPMQYMQPQPSPQQYAQQQQQQACTRGRSASCPIFSRLREQSPEQNAPIEFSGGGQGRCTSSAVEPSPEEVVPNPEVAKSEVEKKVCALKKKLREIKKLKDKPSAKLDILQRQKLDGEADIIEKIQSLLGEPDTT